MISLTTKKYSKKFNHRCKQSSCIWWYFNKNAKANYFIILQNCLKSSFFPDDWRKGNIVSAHKKIVNN